MFLNVKYAGDILDKENIIEVKFNIFKKYLPIELTRYVDDYVVEESKWKGVYNYWCTKLIKGNTRAVK